IFEEGSTALEFRSQFMDYIPVERFGLKIVKPWFDHPPLGTALIALPARLLGYRGFTQIPNLVVRLPALIASIFTLLFTYLLAEKLFNKKTAFFSLLFLATIPYFVLAHRQSFIENLLTPVILGGILAAINYIKSKKNKWLYLLMGISFLTGWFKITGFIIPFLMAGFIMFMNKKRMEGWKLSLVGILSILSYLAYGFIADKQVFLFTLMNQGSRGAFVSSLFDGITKPEFYGAFRDGWYLLGFITSFSLLLNKKSRTFSWFFSGWLIVLWLTAGRMANSPWYRYPLIPFMSMGIGFYINKLWKKSSLFLSIPFLMIGLTGIDLMGMEIPAILVRLASVVFLVPLVLNLMFKNLWLKKLSGLWVKLLIIGLILINITASIGFYSHICTQKRCLAPNKIIIYDK
ncbi:MAG: glycosyltransferase family 39 protein, partial [Patescibacteria group bacterium]|nr:glycosyltransferase family 39 protein [Patescibacteria group bacterium]